MEANMEAFPSICGDSVRDEAIQEKNM